MVRILLDESLPRRLANEFEGLDVSTVRREGWLGLRNGVLLRAAVEAGFSVIVTTDRAMRYQDNLERIGIAVIVLTKARNNFRDLRMLVPQIRSILPLLRPGDAYEISPLPGDLICDRPYREAVAITGLSR